MKAIVSVLGQDKKGIIAKVSGCLYSLDINIEDISQTLLQGCFSMIMMVDMTDSPASFKETSDKLNEVAAEMGVEIKLQARAIFEAMHKLL